MAVKWLNESFETSTRYRIITTNGKEFIWKPKKDYYTGEFIDELKILFPNIKSMSDIREIKEIQEYTKPKDAKYTKTENVNTDEEETALLNIFEDRLFDLLYDAVDKQDKIMRDYYGEEWTKIPWRGKILKRADMAWRDVHNTFRRY